LLKNIKDINKMKEIPISNKQQDDKIQSKKGKKVLIFVLEKMF